MVAWGAFGVGALQGSCRTAPECPAPIRVANCPSYQLVAAVVLKIS